MIREMEKEIEAEKINYINNVLESEYLIKSYSAASTYLAVNTTIFLVLAINFQQNWPFLISTIIVFIPTYLKTKIAKKFIDKQISTSEAFLQSSKVSMLGMPLWALNALLIIWQHSYSDLISITVFILTLATISASPISLSSHKKLFLTFNISYALSLITYSIERFFFTNDKVYLIIFFLMVVNFVYTLRQRKWLYEETIKRVSYEWELRKSFEALKEETAKTFHAARLSSIGEMSKSMAHEINNPLMIIQGLAKQLIRLAENPINSEEQIKDKSQKVLHASERIAHIVASLKAITETEEKSENVVFNVPDLLTEIVDFYKEKALSSNIHLNMINNGPVYVNWSPGHFTQILVNLLNNSFEAIHENRTTHPKIDVILEIKNEDIFVRVANSGPIINSDTQKNLFEPFFTTKQKNNKLGLGLSISKSFATQNQADLFYENKMGFNTFTLKLKKENINIVT
jgi:signal transduction histidine kinase